MSELTEMPSSLNDACRKLDLAYAEIERLRNLVSDLVDLVDEMPIKHPQQSERRNELRRRFDVAIGHQQKGSGA